MTFFKWMLLLSFLLGAIITWFLVIRRVTREVPVTTSKSRVGVGTAAAGAAAVGAAGAAATAKRPSVDVKKPSVDVKAPAAGAAGVAAGATAAGARATTPRVETKAPAAPAPRVETKAAAPAAAAAPLAAGRFGKDSADAGANGSGPAGWTIKGNADSMLYHTTESPYYGRTKAEVWFRTEEAASAAGFTRWDRKNSSKGGATGGAAGLASNVPAGPYGAGSAKPAADGSGPAGWAVKGNVDSMLYHTEESPTYRATVAEIWFKDVATAQAAGFNRWDSGKSKRD